MSIKLKLWKNNNGVVYFKWYYILTNPIKCKAISLWSNNRIGGVMVIGLASSAVDRRFESQSGNTKDYDIGICCFSANHSALRS